MISVVVTTYNNELLPFCLDGFADQSERDFELCIVNDGGEPLSLTNCKYYYLSPPSSEYRLAAARHLGISNCTGERIVLTDSDCIPDRHFIRRQLAYCRTDLVVAGVRKHIKAQLRSFSDVFICPWVGDRRLSLRLVNDVDIAANCHGCNLSFPRKAYDGVGGFSDFVGWGFEDVELACRLVEYGCKPFFDKLLIVYHLDHPQRKINCDNYKKYLITKRRLERKLAFGN